MKKIHIMLCLALGILVSGCFTSYVSTKQMMGIYQGMTQSQVESVLGKPDFRRFDGDMEEWEFHRDNGTPCFPCSLCGRKIHHPLCCDPYCNETLAHCDSRPP